MAFDLICQYAEREGWVPIGWREWTLGEWRIRVNGTRQEREAIPPYHAAVEHTRYVAMALINPFGGSTLGWARLEDEFIRDITVELERDRGVGEK